MEGMNIRYLLGIFLFMSVMIIIFYPLHASGTEQPRYNEASKNNYDLEDNSIAEQHPKIGSLKFEAVKEIFKSEAYLNESSPLDNQSDVITFGLPSFLSELPDGCHTNFNCTSNFTTGWRDKTSIQFSTINNKTLEIDGHEVDVNPNEEYRLVLHMKLNEWAAESRAKMEGFNESSQQWYQIKRCLAAKNGPLEWKEYSCLIVVPENTTKIRPVLRAGKSSQLETEAITWFDSIYMIKLKQFITDPNLKAEIVYSGLEFPTTMAFLGPNDFLVLEWHKGTVQRIVNGTVLTKPILDVNVAKGGEKGMLGIAVAKNTSASQTSINKESTYVFLYFTEAEKDGGEALANRVYRYELVDNKLINSKLLLELPSGLRHNAGKMLIGPDNYLYIMIGEALINKTSQNRALNYEGTDVDEPDGRGGILRIDQNGGVPDTHGILGDEEPLNKYYAYGIRNSFGMDFDPLTGKLWDTENGPTFGDEINLVEPGFNSGWNKVQGIWTLGTRDKKGDLASEKPDNLVDFNGKGNYSSPEFTWNKTLAPTAIKFLSSDKLGKEYENDMFVADDVNGRIYHFKLNQNRTALLLEGPLIDKVADNDKELDNVVFARGFGGIVTDLGIGPDGYLYVVGHSGGQIYRIVPVHSN